MAFFLRRLVSQQKRRFQQDGFDLDLAYITQRIIAMGLPAEGGEGFYRNPISEITKFLQHYHPHRHRVYNLCAERTYNPDRLLCDVAHYPFDDHQPPPLSMVHEFVGDAYNFLTAHPDNVIAVHCKAGKGRTGTMICCLLLFLASQKSSLLEGCRVTENAVMDVLHWYADKRTMNRKGITLQSQQRFVNYFYSTLQCPTRHLEYSVQVHIQEIRIRNLPEYFIQSALVTVYHRDGTRRTRPCVSGSPLKRALKAASCLSLPQEPPPSAVSLLHSQEVLVSLAEQPSLQGDIKIQLFKGTSSVFYTWFNTAFLPPSSNAYCLSASQLDRPAKGLPRDVQVEVVYHHPPPHPTTPRRNPSQHSSGRLLHAAPAEVLDISDASCAEVAPASPKKAPLSASKVATDSTPTPSHSPRPPPLTLSLPLNSLHASAHQPTASYDPHSTPASITGSLAARSAFDDDSVLVKSVLNLRLPRPLTSPLISPRIPSPGTPPACEPPPGTLFTRSSISTLDSPTHPPNLQRLSLDTDSHLAFDSDTDPSYTDPHPSLHTALHTAPQPSILPLHTPPSSPQNVSMKPSSLLYSCPGAPPAEKHGLFQSLLNRFQPRRKARASKAAAAAAASAAASSQRSAAAGAGAEGRVADPHQWQQFQQAWHTRWWMRLD